MEWQSRFLPHSPFVSAWLVHGFGTPMAPAYYVTIVAVVCLLAVQFVPETRGIRLRTSIAGVSEEYGHEVAHDSR